MRRFGWVVVTAPFFLAACRQTPTASVAAAPAFVTATLSEDVSAIVPQIGHQDMIAAIAASPDGKTVAAVDGKLKLWDAQSGALRRTFALPLIRNGYGLRLCFSPDGNRLALLGESGERGRRAIYLFDVPSGQRIASVGALLDFPDIALSKTQLLAITSTARLVRWDAQSGAAQSETKLPSPTRFAPREWLSPRGHAVLFSGFEAPSVLCDTKGHRAITLRGEGQRVSAAAFSGDGKVLVTAHESPRSRGGALVYVRLALWDAASGRQRRVINAFGTSYGSEPRAVAIAPDGAWVAAIGNRGQSTIARLWDARSGALRREWAAPAPDKVDTAFANTLAAAPDGNSVWIGLSDGGLWQLPLQGAARCLNPGGMASAVDRWQRFAWSPDGEMLAASSEIGSPRNSPMRTIRLWNLREGKLRDGFWGALTPPRFVPSKMGRGAFDLQSGLAALLDFCSFSPDGKLLAVNEAGDLVVRNVQSGAVVQKLGNKQLRGPWTAFWWSPDSKKLTALCDPEYFGRAMWSGQPSPKPIEPFLTLWDVTTGKLISRPQNIKEQPAPQFKIVPGGIEVHDFASGTRTVRAVNGRAREIVTSADNSAVGVRLGSDSLEVHAVADWKLLGTLPVPPPESGRPPSFSLSPHGKRLAKDAGEGRLEIWDVASARLFATLQMLPSGDARKGPTDWFVAFADGRFQASPGTTRSLKRRDGTQLQPFAR